MNPFRTTFALAALSLPALPALAQLPQAQAATALAWGDVDGDGRLDLYLADPTGGDRSLVGRAEGAFEDRSDALGALRHSVAALLLDVDRDGTLDIALLGRDGKPRLLIGVEDGGWIDASEPAGLGELAGGIALRALDYDADGWPDLALRSASSELLLHSGRGRLFTQTLSVPAPPDGPTWILAGASERAGEGPRPTDLGTMTGSTNGPKVEIRPGGGASRALGGHICAGTIEDFAAPATCLSASSVPVLGMLFPLSIELFVDAATGNVGIGTTSPGSTLDVAGTARMDGFTLPTGAGDGKVLVSDASGNGTWQSVASANNTLDQAYDEGGKGAGRAIAADTGAVVIAASGNDALQLTTDGSSDALAVDVSSDPGGNGVLVLQNGAGSGVRIEHSGPSTGIEVRASSPATQAATIDVTDAGNALAAVEVRHDGKGVGVDVELANAASTATAVRGITSGTGRGVFGLQGPDPEKGNAAAKAGVAGESRDSIGVSGWCDTGPGVQGRSEEDDGVQGHSKDGNGVGGSTERTGTWAAGSGSGAMLRAGVKGTSSDVASPDNFAVVGNASGYGSGVLGLGGADAGHGVFGISHSSADGDKTISGVRGVTRESPNTHWSLQDGTGKVKVGVLGQAKDYAGVWGESTARVGVAGTGGAQVPYGHLPSGKVGVYGQAEVKVLDPSQPSEGGVIGLAETLPGVQGWSRAGHALSGLSLEKHGVLGESRSADPAMAGVSARGKGPAGAAALNVHDGAITVSGPSRPAGTFPLTGGWVPYTTCEGGCADCPHAHVMGWRTFETVANPLLKPDSIVLLTVEAPSAAEGYVAHLGGTGDGVMDVVVSTVGKAGPCQQPAVGVSVHYLIVNPLP